MNCLYSSLRCFAKSCSMARFSRRTGTEFLTLPRASDLKLEALAHDGVAVLQVRRVGREFEVFLVLLLQLDLGIELGG